MGINSYLKKTQDIFKLMVHVHIGIHRVVETVWYVCQVMPLEYKVEKVHIQEISGK